MNAGGALNSHFDQKAGSSLAFSKYNSASMSPRIHLVRHGRGLHQLEPLHEHRQIHVPRLTELGVQRCKDSSQHFPGYVHVDLVCANPLRLAILTAKYCFHHVIPKTPTSKILLLPIAQEDTAEPCDFGSRPDIIKQAFGDLVDASMVREDWTSKEGVYAPRLESLKARARELRLWLREQPERDIVVVGHGAFWDYVIGAVGENGALLGALLSVILMFQLADHGFRAKIRMG